MTASVSSPLSRLLDHLEEIGNKLPHPTVLFIYLCVLILVLSKVFTLLDLSAIHPLTGKTIESVDLISQYGLHQILQNTVTNFTHFAPLGTVLIAMLGIGIAEHSGLLGTVLRLVVLKAPERLITFAVVLAGILSSLAADSGYVVLIPLSAIVFMAAGRHPIAGIAAAFAGVSGGYSANLLIGPLDAILAGISTEAANLINPEYNVSAAGNYYFILTSTFLIAAIGTWVTDKIVAPRLERQGGSYDKSEKTSQNQQLSDAEKRGLRYVGLFTLGFIALLLAGLLPESGVLRHPETGSILRSPFIKGIVTLIAIYSGIAGWCYSRGAKTLTEKNAVITSMETTMATMASYLVLMFFAAQFVNYFAWTNLGLISAIQGSALLKALAIGPVWLMLCFILLTTVLNLLIGSSSAKWAIMAPVFIPMLYLLGISPESTQVAYRIGDSVTNIITPLMPYFALVVAFVQRYNKDAGIGTIITTMLPYSFFFLITWSCLLVIWITFNLPLGPGAPLFISP